MEKKKLAHIPYGLQDVTSIKNEGYAYVDKTRFIEHLENSGSKFHYIIRPRRFGKTVFTEILNLYYDISQVSNFEKNFSGTYIGKHKTVLASSYYILSLNLAGCCYGNTTENITSVVKSAIYCFIEQYDFKDLRPIVEKEYEDLDILLDDFFEAINKKVGKKVYVIIDEYDQFAIELFTSDYKKFERLTSSSNFLKNFYTSLKNNTQPDRPIARIFITGVTSLTLDSLELAPDFLQNISNLESFASMFGFTELELKMIIPQVIDLEKYGHSVDEVLKRIKQLYQGYNFCPNSQEIVFNPSACFSYLEELKSANTEPDALVDSGFTPSLRTINKFLKKGDPKHVKKIIDNAITGKTFVFDQINPSFKVNSQDVLEQNGIISSLLCFGYLTWSNNGYTLKVPNRSVAQLFFEYYFKYLRGIENLSIETSFFKNAFIKLRQGSPEALLKIVAAKLQDARCLYLGDNLHESDIAVVLAQAGNFSPDFNVHLELEVAATKNGYPSLILSPLEGVNCSYIVELKYLPKSEGCDEAVKEKLDEAKDLIDRYCQDNNIAMLPNLKRVACVFVGTEIASLDVC